MARTVPTAAGAEIAYATLILVTGARHGYFGRDGAVALVMLLFGLGAAIPLLAIGMVSRAALMRTRGRLISGGVLGRRLLGGGPLTIGAIVLVGLDHRLEALLLQLSPGWLTSLTTRYRGEPSGSAGIALRMKAPNIGTVNAVSP